MLLQIPKEMKKDLIEAFGTERLAMDKLLNESSDDTVSKIVKKYKDQIDWE